MADYETLVEVRNWNLNMMQRAKNEGRERDAWRYSDNAESLRAYLDPLLHRQSRKAA